jgi:hypothetical protein
VPTTSSDGKRPAVAAGLSRIGFALVALACVGALFLTQKIKDSPPLVQASEHTSGPSFDPRGSDLAHRFAVFSFATGYTDDVTVSIVAEPSGAFIAYPDLVHGPRVVLSRLPGGQVIVARDIRMRLYDRHTFRWNGLTAAGRLAPPGTYEVQLHMFRHDRTLIVPGIVFHLKDPAP